MLILERVQQQDERHGRFATARVDKIPSLFFFCSFLFPLPCIATTHQGCVGRNVHVRFAGDSFSSCCPRERKAARNGLKTRRFALSRYTRLLSFAISSLVFSTYRGTTLANLRTRTLDFLIQWRHSVLVKPRVTSDRRTSAFIPNAVLVASYFYPVINSSRVRRDNQHARNMFRLTYIQCSLGTPRVSCMMRASFQLKDLLSNRKRAITHSTRCRTALSPPTGKRASRCIWTASSCATRRLEAIRVAQRPTATLKKASDACGLRERGDVLGKAWRLSSCLVIVLLQTRLQVSSVSSVASRGSFFQRLPCSSRATRRPAYSGDLMLPFSLQRSLALLKKMRPLHVRFPKCCAGLAMALPGLCKTSLPSLLFVS